MNTVPYTVVKPCGEAAIRDPKVLSLIEAVFVAANATADLRGPEGLAHLMAIDAGCAAVADAVQAGNALTPFDRI
ncbi:MAG: hypothetical protein ACREUA_01160 [Burkholderiales bacterium]